MRVLIVDDAAINIRIYEGVLRGQVGLEFSSFTSSANALLWAEENEADLALVDYNMPPPNGLEFIERFRAIPKNRDASIIMVTGETEKDIRYRALEIGANDFLVKPVDPIELAARARNMIALADGRRKLSDRAAWLASEVKRATEHIRDRERETIMRLTRAAEYRDNETGMHIVRMGHFCAMIGREAGLSESDCEMLLLAAPMHDVGKVATPDKILLKPGKLAGREWEIMKEHTLAGYDILKDSESELLQTAAAIALGHHEKYDGSGYPNGLRGDDIPLFARICAISDVFDALTSVRPYKRAWAIMDAVTFMRGGRGAHFDPALMDAFDRALPLIVEAKHIYADEAPPRVISGEVQETGRFTTH